MTAHFSASLTIYLNAAHLWRASTRIDIHSKSACLFHKYKNDGLHFLLFLSLIYQAPSLSRAAGKVFNMIYLSKS